MFLAALSAAASFSCIFPPDSGADIYLLRKKHTDPIEVMGTTTTVKDEYITLWISTGKLRQATGRDPVLMNADPVFEDHVQLYVFDEEIFYNIDNLFLTYNAYTVGGDQGVISDITIAVEETGRKREIRGWPCIQFIKRVVVSGITMNTEIWATEEVDIDLDQYGSIMKRHLFLSGEGKDENLLQLEKIRGAEVLEITKVEVMGVTTRTTEELLEIGERPAPSGLYDLPKSYQLVEIPSWQPAVE
jgi:hypothetical protein